MKDLFGEGLKETQFSSHKKKYIIFYIRKSISYVLSFFGSGLSFSEVEFFLFLFAAFIHRLSAKAFKTLYKLKIIIKINTKAEISSLGNLLQKFLGIGSFLYAFPTDYISFTQSLRI